MGNDESQGIGIKEIAIKANVSIGTVDRVLNNRVGVSQKTKDKVLAIVKEFDYKPNIMARRLASKKIVKLAVLIPAVSTETGYWNAPLNGINQAAEELSNFGVRIDKYFFDQNDRQTFDQQMAAVFDKEYHGALLAPMFESESKRFLVKCQDKKIPTVLINSDLNTTARISYVGPDLFQSGYVAAHLSKYLISEKQSALIVNISKEIDLHHHLLKKEEGFKAYFEKAGSDLSISKIDIRNTDYDSIKLALDKVMAAQKIDLVFVTNSRVASVAKYFADRKIKNVKLIGYDFLEENVNYMKENVIDFLICQKPQEQGYRGIMTLYQHLNGNAENPETQYMPIDILTKENYQYYKN
ncbi:substrate-binding domain-containing protein [Sphingobacterium corticis]|uniref:Substrate-binding domain-containing protein n=1 Tax=Sphingobacterium corticis TaxID=1812823 RepID=A0ABW5NNN4_9SPHI